MQNESKLQKALRLVNEGMNPHAAAKEAGLKQASMVYRALKLIRDKQQGICSCCGAPVDVHGHYMNRPGFRAARLV